MTFGVLMFLDATTGRGHVAMRWAWRSLLAIGIVLLMLITAGVKLDAAPVALPVASTPAMEPGTWRGRVRSEFAAITAATEQPGRSPDCNLFRVRDGKIFARNSEYAFARVKGLSAICAWIDYAGRSLGDFTGVTLIAPDFVVCCRHSTPIGAGVRLTFVTEDGTDTVHVRTVTGDGRRVANTDIVLFQLDRPLPDTIRPLKLMGPPNWRQERLLDADRGGANGLGDRLPLWSVNRGMVTIVQSYCGEEAFGHPEIELFRYEPDGPYARYGFAPGSGDSGHPLCLILDGQLVLVSHFHSRIHGDSYAYFAAQVAAAISERRASARPQGASVGHMDRVSGSPSVSWLH